jgi:LmbE family N-acetylglucosaminyl deacetylase
VKPDGPLLVISPHCDDAVLGCGGLLARYPGTTVVTVFAGSPPSYEPFTEWDRASGFQPGDDVMALRREEDRRALSLLDARPLWLDFLDAQYAGSPPVDVVAARLDEVLDGTHARSVLIPAGLFHSDHVLTHQAALRVLNAHLELDWYLYEDALYRLTSALLSERLARLNAAGYVANRTSPCETEAPRKRDAIDCYASQLRALATPGRPGHRDAYAPEAYWRVSRCAP